VYVHNNLRMLKRMRSIDCSEAVPNYTRTKHFTSLATREEVDAATYTMPPVPRNAGGAPHRWCRTRFPNITLVSHTPPGERTVPAYSPGRDSIWW
jgi:hypothetical protein